MSSIPKFSADSYDFTEFVPARNFIGGEWCESKSGESLEVINPRFGKAMSKVAMSGAEDVDAAVKNAAAAAAEWCKTPIKERCQVFFRAKQLMEENLDELSWLVSHENGKTFAEAKAEVLKGIECVEFGTSVPNQIGLGEQLDVSRGVNCRQTHEPYGVVAGVTPFNFPFMVPLWMMPQAIVAGNAFILKPSEQVPLSALRLAGILQEAGLPDGVFNIVHGGVDAVNGLCDHPGIKAMAFVGSTKVAKLVYARGAQQFRPMLCLGGAKNHLMIVPDADEKVTVDNVVASFTGCAGQRCMAASVLVAVGDVDHLIEKVAARAREINVGTDMGAITNSQSVERITGYIDRAEASGSKILVDGRGQKGNDEGYWVGPTIIDNAKPGDAAACEEIFGPVITIVRVNNLEEAIELENSNPYGNAAAIYTTSGAVADHVVSRVEAGMVGVNIGVPVPREPFGFGGWNDSRFGNGNITGIDGYRFWTRPRKVTTKWELQEDANWMS